ncbi:MAG: hypothetical protein IJY22_02090 [Clostridia bacterium]|nr:hypothetical protein [Clostridia bacterium]
MPRKTAGNDGTRRTATEVRRLLVERAPEALAVLVEIMRDGEQKPELRMKAAESVLDRACGKAASATGGDVGDRGPTTGSFEGVLEEWSR